MSMRDRGFASMDKNKQREICRKGGKAAHEQKVAHEWTKEEASIAGKKGAAASIAKRKELKNGSSSSTVS
jgi:uncharacterized protein